MNIDNLNVEKDNLPHYTYKIQNGWSDIRVGQLIFEKEGLDKLLNPDRQHLRIISHLGM